jgi:NhaP-type Na+/H+ and K+/H+ antiporter
MSWKNIMPLRGQKKLKANFFLAYTDAPSEFSRFAWQTNAQKLRNMAFALSTLPADVTKMIEQDKTDLEALDRHHVMMRKIDNELYMKLGDRVHDIIEHLRYYIDDFFEAEQGLREMDCIYRPGDTEADMALDEMAINRYNDTMDDCLLQISYYSHEIGYLFCTKIAEQHYKQDIMDIKFILDMHNIRIFENC